MIMFLQRIAFLVILSVSFLCSAAQKNIVIADSLSANAEQLNVKLGGQGWGKIWKIKFGDYVIVSSKLGWTTTTNRGNFWGTKSTSSAKDKFSFILSNNSTDTATVDAVNYVSSEYSHSINLSPKLSLGTDELKKWSQNFSAFITLNNDTANTWALLMNGSASLDTTGKYEAYLLNGERRIVLTPVTSNKNHEDKRMVPALGYEFIENNKSLAALQYYGGGMLGRNRDIVWLHKNLDTKTKLLLSAAITAILQLKESEM